MLGKCDFPEADMLASYIDLERAFSFKPQGGGRAQDQFTYLKKAELAILGGGGG